MNTLSWLLYAAGVVGGIGFTCSLIAIICLVSQVLWIPLTELDDAPQGATGLLKKAFVVGVVCLFVAIAVPTKETLYAIAAAELGEEAYKSALGQKAMKALESFIDKQIPKEAK